jgi:hypothetical protein
MITLRLYGRSHPILAQQVGINPEYEKVLN